jgi:hypothetical protein
MKWTPRGGRVLQEWLSFPMFLLPICILIWALMATPVDAESTPTPTEIIGFVAVRDKQLVERRKAFDYDMNITRDQLDSDKKVVSTSRDKVVVTSNRGPGYGTRPASPGDPQQEQQKTSREEPFELLKMVDHYTYTLDGEETVDGVDCYKIGFTPKPDMPYENREEKVLNNVSGHIWASKRDYSLIKNEGSLMHPVSVAWIFATLREMEFHFDAMQMPNGDYGPGRLQYRYLVNIPFMQLHERDTRVMSHYRLTGTEK